MTSVIRSLALFLGIVLSTALVILGRGQIGPQGLGIMLLGLAGLALCLYAYNRRWR